MKKLLFALLISASFCVNAQSDGYKKLQRSLSAFSDNPSITVFVDTDYNFCATALSGFLQTEMGLSSKDFKYGLDEISESFVPKASKEDLNLKVTYDFDIKENIEGYVEADEIVIIKSVNITGSPKLIGDLFLSFWPGKPIIKKIGNQNIATKELLSDFISMKLLANGTGVITITKGGTNVNYETTYGINKEKLKD
ncbi:hypothetical protein HSX10_03580 [Winogradskyella undariae]|uniref:hypothetical protein n=1 Tax=Winogradskyella undariae TaxID=1285465 RepID=UPI00156B9B37|nr:hypothetical protein [Winogradskyella undariae]NRR90640.1 hypothetical protein [Winogradskyella undariae]